MHLGSVFAGVELVLGGTFAVPIGIMTLVFITGDTVTGSPIAAVFTFLPILISALLTVISLRLMKSRTHPSAAGNRQQSVRISLCLPNTSPLCGMYSIYHRRSDSNTILPDSSSGLDDNYPTSNNNGLIGIAGC